MATVDIGELKNHLENGDPIDEKTRKKLPPELGFIEFVVRPKDGSEAEKQMFNFARDRQLKVQTEQDITIEKISANGAIQPHICLGKSNATRESQIKLPLFDSRLCAITSFKIQVAGERKDLKLGETVELRRLQGILSSGSFMVDNLRDPFEPKPLQSRE